MSRPPAERSDDSRPARRQASGRWYAPGDVNAFFGLAVDNLTNLVVLAGLLVGVFGFPSDLVLYRIVPGTALGVLAGDLWYTWLARRLARETGRPDVTAMPFGIDTPSLFGITFGVLGPVMLATRDPVLAWKVGHGRHDRHGRLEARPRVRRRVRCGASCPGPASSARSRACRCS